MEEFIAIDSLVERINHFQKEFQKEWTKDTEFQKFNYKKKQVRNFEEIKVNIFRHVLTLRRWVLTSGFDDSIKKISLEVNYRIKAENSILQKYATYLEKSECGKIPIKKCFNDLLGIRVILESEYILADVKKHLKEKFSDLKVTDASKNEYKAVHMYFSGNNFELPWELQVWNKNDEIQNKVSHRMYKQGYTRWEQEFGKERESCTDITSC